MGNIKWGRLFVSCNEQIFDSLSARVVVASKTYFCDRRYIDKWFPSGKE